MDASQFLPTRPKLLEFNAVKEPWAEYELEDGSVVRVRVMLVKALDQGQRGPDGYPILKLNCQQVIDVTWSESAQADAAAHAKPEGQG